ncbi:glycosyltransferase 8 domain-containing protein 1-like isoform X2 [Periplaneta americana]|uniref:glycosyltransferase 8 domain-containing protein 1-like isoform X2 n=1 Tax=Periplaneta americana TaxID=6978 RepID=UPI0037E7FD5B
MSSLRLKFGGLLALVLCWSLLVVYLVTLLEWVPAPFAILQNEPAVTTPTIITTTTTLRPKAVPSPTSRAPPTEAGPRGEMARVLIASDGTCLGGLVSAVNSVLLHTRRSVKFYIITTAEELPHLKVWIEATKLHKMTYELHTLAALTRNITGGLQHIKAHVPDLFPELWGRLVYLDCDVIVQGDIWELFTADIRPGHYGAFSQNCIGPPVGGRAHYGAFVNLRHSALNGSQMNQEACPFATGVFVANLTLWRWHDVPQRVQHWLKLHKREKIVGSHPSADAVEAAMLIVLYGKVTVLDPLWHVQHLGTSELQQSVLQAVH